MMNRLLLTLFLLWATLSSALGVRIGLVSDVHYADKPSVGKRSYRDSLKKLDKAVAAFDGAKLDFVVELGDFIDSAPTAEAEADHVRTINAVFKKFRGPRHYVLGNHDVESLAKGQFLAICGAKQPFYSFDSGGFHFVVLDACHSANGKAYRAKRTIWTDADIPTAERDWLAADLKATDKKTICFIHHRLDVNNKYAAKSAPIVRKILEDSDRVLAVFQGHAHANNLAVINGIRYFTFSAMVDGPGAYSILEIKPDNSLCLTGFRGHKSYDAAR